VVLGMVSSAHAQTVRGRIYHANGNSKIDPSVEAKVMLKSGREIVTQHIQMKRACSFSKEYRRGLIRFSLYPSGTMVIHSSIMAPRSSTMTLRRTIIALY
jgi:hypothetical protein